VVGFSNISGCSNEHEIRGLDQLESGKTLIPVLNIVLVSFGLHLSQIKQCNFIRSQQSYRLIIGLTYCR
jgi:hypothetical protein